MVKHKSCFYWVSTSMIEFSFAHDFTMLLGCTTRPFQTAVKSQTGTTKGTDLSISMGFGQPWFCPTDSMFSQNYIKRCASALKWWSGLFYGIKTVVVFLLISFYLRDSVKICVIQKLLKVVFGFVVMCWYSFDTCSSLLFFHRDRF